MSFKCGIEDFAQRSRRGSTGARHSSKYFCSCNCSYRDTGRNRADQAMYPGYQPLRHAPRPIITPANIKPGTAINTRLSRAPKRVDATTVKDTLVKKKRTTIELTKKANQMGMPNANRTTAKIASTAVMTALPL